MLRRMQRPWEADHEVDADGLRALIAAQFPDLADASIEFESRGWDNACFLVDGRWLFRVPRRELGARLMDVENAVLPLLAERLPLPIPAPRFVGVPQGDYPWAFHGYERLAGETLCRAAPGHDARCALAAPLGRFLRALHDTPVDALPGLPDDDNRRLDIPFRTEQLEERFADMRRVGLIGDTRPWDRVRDAVPTDYAAAATHVVHGDLYARHLLVDDDDAACGVIDWGDVHRGDPAIDLCLVNASIPSEAHADFLAEYGPVDETTWAVGRFKALHSSLMILAYGSDVGDAALVREGLGALERLAR